MNDVALVFALALPIVVGMALLAALLPRGPAAPVPGLLAWLGGAGFLIGVLAVTTIMRLDSRLGIPFGVASIAGPALALAAVSSWIAWRRATLAGYGRDALAGLCATELPRGARVAWFALLAWMTVRVVLLALEASLRPLFAWDAWSAWATKAKAYAALHAIVPFADVAGWMTATTPVWFDAAPFQPATLPLLQAWMATAVGAWSDGAAALPWCLYLVALLLVVFGELRRREAPPLHALVAAWLVASMPLLGTQVALAGYADLPLATAFTLFVLAGSRAIAGRALVDVVVALAAAASLVLTKQAGWAWVVVALPGLAAVALGPSWHRRAGVTLVVVALAVVGIAARFPGFALGPVTFRYSPVWETLATDTLLLANWHLLAIGLVGTLALRWRRAFDSEVAPLSLVLAAGLLWIAILASFPSFRAWGADYLGLNRAVLVLAPFAVAWMAIALLEPARVPPAANEPVAESAPPAPLRTGTAVDEAPPQVA